MPIETEREYSPESRKYPDGRCRAMLLASKTGQRCRRNCLPGEDRCEQHFNFIEDSLAVRGDAIVHKFYVAKLRPTMLSAIEQVVSEAAGASQLSLYDELLLCRDAASHSVGTYSEARELLAAADLHLARCDDPSSGASPEQRDVARKARMDALEATTAAAAAMQEQLRLVADMVDRAAKVEDVKARVGDSIMGAMAAFMTQVVSAAQRVFKDDHLVADFEREIRISVEAASERVGKLGTDLTPDQLDAQVAAMDAAAPGAVPIPGTAPGAVVQTTIVAEGTADGEAAKA